MLSALTLVELLQTAKIIGSGYFRYLEPYTIVGLLFLLMSYVSAVMIRRMESWINRKYNRGVPQVKAEMPEYF